VDQIEEPKILHRRRSNDTAESLVQARDQRTAEQEQADQIRQTNFADPYQTEAGYKKRVADPYTGEVTEHDAEEFAKTDAKTGQQRVKLHSGAEMVVGTDESVVERQKLLAQRRQLRLQDSVDEATLADTRAQLEPVKNALKEYGKTPDALKQVADKMRAGINPNAPDPSALKRLTAAEDRLKAWHKQNPGYAAQKAQFDALDGQINGLEQSKRDRRWQIIATMADPETAKRLAIRPRDLSNPQEAQIAEAAAAIPKPPEEAGDFVRGAKVSLKQIKPLAQGTLALLGATAEKAVGKGGLATKLKSWGIKGYQAGMAETEGLAKPTDDIGQSWKRAKAGDVGALVDWAQYGAGYLTGQIGETVAISALGALVGSAVGPEGTIAGAVGGGVAKTATKGLIKTAIEKVVEKTALKQGEELFAKKGVKASAEQVAKYAASTAGKKEAAATIGRNVALFGNSLVQEAGSIFPEAVQQAAKEGRELTGTDLARVWATSIAAGGIDALTDKLGLDIAHGKLKAGGGRIVSAAKTAIGGAAVEGGTEVAQTVLERLGARQSLTGDEAFSDYLNSGALGALGGGSVGAIGSILARKQAAVAQSAGEVEQSKAQGTTARNNGDIKAAAQADSNAETALGKAHRAGMALVDTIPAESRAKIARAIDVEADPAGNEESFASNPTHFFASAEIGRVMRENGAARHVPMDKIASGLGVDPSTAELVADQHAGAAAIRALAAFAGGGKALDERQANALRSLGLIDEVNRPDGTFVDQITDDAVALLPPAVVAAIKQNPDAAPILSTPGETGDILSNLVSGGLKRFSNFSQQGTVAGGQNLQSEPTSDTGTSRVGGPASFRYSVVTEAPGGVATDEANVRASSPQEAEAKIHERAQKAGRKVLSLTPVATAAPQPASESKSAPPAAPQPQAEPEPAPESSASSEPSVESPAPESKPDAEIAHESNAAIIKRSKTHEERNAAFAEREAARKRIGSTTLGEDIALSHDESGSTAVDYDGSGQISINVLPADVGTTREEEELIHAAALSVLREQWITQGKPGNFEQFVRADSLRRTNDLLAGLEQVPANERAALEGAMLAAFNVYFESYDKAAPEVQSVSDLVQALNDDIRSTGGDRVISFFQELVRQGIQLRRSGEISEQSLRSFMASAVRWLQEALAQLRKWVSTLDDSALSKGSLAELIRQTEAELAEWESKSVDESTPGPFVSSSDESQPVSREQSPQGEDAGAGSTRSTTGERSAADGENANEPDADAGRQLPAEVSATGGVPSAVGKPAAAGKPANRAGRKGRGGKRVEPLTLKQLLKLDREGLEEAIADPRAVDDDALLKLQNIFGKQANQAARLKVVENEMHSRMRAAQEEDAAESIASATGVEITKDKFGKHESQRPPRRRHPRPRRTTAPRQFNPRRRTPQAPG
jgi:hypothetical protein